MWALVFMAFALFFGRMAARAASRGYTYDRGGSRITKEESPSLFWMFVGLDFFYCALSAVAAVSAPLR